MITTQAASRAILAAMPGFDCTPVPLEDAAGRILRQGVAAERDQPPFDRVTMDGIALKFQSLAAGNRRFRIEGTQHAGDPVQTLAASDGCIEIMTGGVLPGGCDCVVPVERIAVADGVAEIEAGYEATQGQFVHGRGSDYSAGQEVLSPGGRISPMDVAIIASCGIAEVSVSRGPRIAVISTGNELVPPGEPIAAHQVRLSNGPALVAMLRRQGFDSTSSLHLVDDRAVLRERLETILHASDVLVLSGGVSMGKADFVPGVLRELGVEVVFHKISQRPGKPMWFGMGPKQQAVFALPGNPVSTLVCCRQYVLPALLHASGRRNPPAGSAILAEPYTFRPPLTCFLPVRVASGRDGAVRATPVPTNTSGDFAALSGTDGYVELALDRDDFAAGTVVPLHRWDSP